MTNRLKNKFRNSRRPEKRMSGHYDTPGSSDRPASEGSPGPSGVGRSTCKSTKGQQDNASAGIGPTNDDNPAVGENSEMNKASDQDCAETIGTVLGYGAGKVVVQSLDETAEPEETHSDRQAEEQTTDDEQ